VHDVQYFEEDTVDFVDDITMTIIQTKRRRWTLEFMITWMSSMDPEVGGTVFGHEDHVT